MENGVAICRNSRDKRMQGAVLRPRPGRVNEPWNMGRKREKTGQLTSPSEVNKVIQLYICLTTVLVSARILGEKIAMYASMYP